jgi:hypothetical protein
VRSEGFTRTTAKRAVIYTYELQRAKGASLANNPWSASIFRQACEGGRYIFSTNHEWPSNAYQTASGFTTGIE